MVESLEPRGEIHLQIFSMSRDKAVRAAQVQANADAIITELKAGRDCAFATLGDAMTYSTFGYVLEIIRESIPGVELEIVPGITSFATPDGESRNCARRKRRTAQSHPILQVGNGRNAGLPQRLHHDSPQDLP